MDPEPKSITDPCFNKQQAKMLIKVRKTLEIRRTTGIKGQAHQQEFKCLTCQEEVPGRDPGEGGTDLHKESDDNLSHERLFPRPPKYLLTPHAMHPYQPQLLDQVLSSVYFRKNTRNTLHTSIHSSDKLCSIPLSSRGLALAYLPT